jgi:hypothetical protein
METTVIKKFEEIGAKVQINELTERPMRPRERNNFSIDIRNGVFLLSKSENTELQILDIDKKGRHLLLLAKIKDENLPETLRNQNAQKQRYLCGHDERDWFTCGIPNVVKTIFEAKEELKPKELRNLESNGAVKTKNKQKRHRKVKGIGKVHRQGEFMFIPTVWSPGKDAIVFKNEPMSQNGRPHVAGEVVRFGGRIVYVRGNNILEEDQFKTLQKTRPNEAKLYRVQSAEPTVYARGTIRHPDHKTLDLGEIWHKVLVNTEKQATFVRNVLFLD